MACGKHTVSTDSIVLRQLRRIRKTYRITNVMHDRQSGGCGKLDFLPSLRTSAHTGVAIRIPHSTHISVTERLGERIATPGDVGHWLAMTVENLALMQPP